MQRVKWSEYEDGIHDMLSDWEKAKIKKKVQVVPQLT